MAEMTNSSSADYYWMV